MSRRLRLRNHNRQSTPSPRAAARRGFLPRLESLEDRLAPAVSWEFTASTGAFVVNIDNDSTTHQYAHLNVVNGFVLVNDTATSVACSAVRSILVTGSDLGNSIRL